MLTLAIFLLAVYGLANAIAVLKIGVHLFGDPVDELILSDGAHMPWKRLVDHGQSFEVTRPNGHTDTLSKGIIQKVLRRKGLGRIPFIGDLFYCPACLSFWIGMATSRWVISPASQVCPVLWKAVLLDGLMACAASWLLHVVSMKMTQGVDNP